jgi:hypothetical protein
MFYRLGTQWNFSEKEIINKVEPTECSQITVPGVKRGWESKQERQLKRRVD